MESTVNGQVQGMDDWFAESQSSVSTEALSETDAEILDFQIQRNPPHIQDFWRVPPEMKPPKNRDIYETSGYTNAQVAL